jgi:DNA-binding NarL/FixJ family response regulator
VNTDRPLTERQVEILQAVADGDTHAEIADALFMTPTAVGSTFVYIRAKLLATNTPNTIAIALRRKLIK